MTLSLPTLDRAQVTPQPRGFARAQPCFAVLRVDALPRRLRPTIESLLVECLSDDSQWALPGADELTAHWCTQWRRDPACPGAVCCREVLTAPAAELNRLRARLGELACAEGFAASLADC